jgi:hypothetical protein
MRESENRIFWSLGRGEGDTMVGVELCFDTKDRLRRTVFSRGKLGRESIIFQEEYSKDEFMELLETEKALLCQHLKQGDRSGAKLQLLEVIQRIRRVYDEL